MADATRFSMPPRSAASCRPQCSGGRRRDRQPHNGGAGVAVMAVSDEARIPCWQLLSGQRQPNPHVGAAVPVAATVAVAVAVAMADVATKPRTAELSLLRGEIGASKRNETRMPQPELLVAPLRAAHDATCKKARVGRVSWETAAWFRGCGSDLTTSHWLVSRCLLWSDVETLADEAAVRHAVVLKRLLDRLKTQLLPETKQASSKATVGWTTQQILDWVAGILLGGGGKAVTRGVAVTTLEGELVATTTELLLQRVAHDEAAALEAWKARLLTLRSALTASALLDSPRGKAIDDAIALTAATIRFHSATVEDRVDPPAEISTQRLTVEINRIYESTYVTKWAEESRMRIALELQDAFRLEPCSWVDWSWCQVLPFGSSVSKFGTSKADLDLCLRLNPYQIVSEAMAAEFKLRNLSLPDGHEQKVTTANDPFKTSATAPDGPVDHTRLGELSAHWQALVTAFKCHGKWCPQPEGMTSTRAVKFDAQAVPETSYEELLMQREQRIYCLYAAAEVLARNGCFIRCIVSNARIPVIKFVHQPSRLECDLAMENYDGYLNTQLLRSYAEFDERVRALGIAIKHWAKQRKLNLTASSYLSSYSFILLMIYFFQTKAKILPNLQNPELRRKAHVTPVILNGVDVSFCADLEQARAFHREQYPERNTQSVGDLLLSFFEFYGYEFDFEELVVNVRHPEQVQSKRSTWGGKRVAKPWCMSIQDPLDVKRDLGSVLNLPNQKRTVEEMTRAFTLLRAGESFEMTVCEFYVGKKKRKQKQKQRGMQRW